MSYIHIDRMTKCAATTTPTVTTSANTTTSTITTITVVVIPQDIETMKLFFNTFGQIPDDRDKLQVLNSKREMLKFNLITMVMMMMMMMMMTMMARIMTTTMLMPDGDDK
ncbi:hypothetical protein GQX74_004413 [Glossina fuscipes]|nr:hypothetical protein GQX74_004413 [Glossina fuscipes]